MLQRARRLIRGFLYLVRCIAGQQQNTAIAALKECLHGVPGIEQLGKQAAQPLCPLAAKARLRQCDIAHLILFCQQVDAEPAALVVDIRRWQRATDHPRQKILPQQHMLVIRALSGQKLHLVRLNAGNGLFERFP